MITRVIFLLAILLCCFSCKNKSSKQESRIEKARDRMSQDFTFESKADSVVENGEQIHYHKNGVIEMRGSMKNGKREGVWKSWYENGLPWSETAFTNGKKNGKTTTWYDNGKKRYEGSFNNDKESGRWVFWKEDGTIADTKNYDLR